MFVSWVLNGAHMILLVLGHFKAITTSFLIGSEEKNSHKNIQQKHWSLMLNTIESCILNWFKEIRGCKELSFYLYALSIKP